MAQREAALEFLASKESSGSHFFDVAARALTIGLGCRWAGFGRLLDDGNTVEVLSFWDTKGPSETFTYSIDDSPCGEVYNSNREEPYRFYPDRVTERFPGPPILAQIGAVSYRGEAIFNSSGVQAAHAFAICDKPFEDDPQDEEFFRLVGQRAGAEYNRQCAEEALIQSREEAVIANLAKSEFLANISHELRTPLNAIIGFSDVMGEELFGPLGDNRYKEYVEGINTSGRHLLDIISNILDISKVESGHMSLDEAPVDLPGMLDICLSIVGEPARAGNVSVAAEYSRNLPPMLADDVKLKQIVLNILSNAVKFTPEGGRVTVRAWVENNDDIAIQVCDTGIGIEAKNIARALEPFRQIEASTRDQSEGTGLGLPLANLLTKLHDGVFDLQSQSGKGTTVSLRFPAARNMLQRAGSVL